MKFCEACNKEGARSNWSVHLKSKKHLENEPEQILKPCKRGRPKLD
jgi:hypothetical protein